MKKRSPRPTLLRLTGTGTRPHAQVFGGGQLAAGWKDVSWGGLFNLSDRAPPPPQGGQRRGFRAASATIAPARSQAAGGAV